MWKKKQYTEKVQWKCAKTVISGKFPAFSAGKKFFLKNPAWSYFDHWYYAFLNKKSVKTNDKISRKCQKTGCSGIFPAFLAEKKMFFDNRAPSHFGHCHFASLGKKSAKTNEPISRKAGNRRMNEQTNERTKVNL